MLNLWHLFLNSYILYYVFLHFSLFLKLFNNLNLKYCIIYFVADCWTVVRGLAPVNWVRCGAGTVSLKCSRPISSTHTRMWSVLRYRRKSQSTRGTKPLTHQTPLTLTLSIDGGLVSRHSWTESLHTLFYHKMTSSSGFSRATMAGKKNSESMVEDI